EPRCQLAELEVLAAEGARVADTQLGLAAAAAQTEAVFPPARHLAPDAELEIALAGIGLGDPLVALPYVDDRPPKVQRRRVEIERLRAERLIEIHGELRLVTDSERRAPLAAGRIDRGAQVARGEAQPRVHRAARA